MFKYLGITSVGDVLCGVTRERKSSSLEVKQI